MGGQTRGTMGKEREEKRASSKRFGVEESSENTFRVLWLQQTPALGIAPGHCPGSLCPSPGSPESYSG